MNGYWIGSGSESTSLYSSRTAGAQKLLSFYRDVYGGNDNTTWGTCYENTTMVQCLSYNKTGEDPVASYDATTDECVFTDEWYRSQCEEKLGGYYEQSTCFVVE